MIRLQPGFVIDNRYRIVRHLADGGMGAVYEAHQEEIDRRVVLKFLHITSAMDKGAVNRFQREAAVLSRLKHPNIVTLYGCGLLDGSLPYLSLEFLEGVSLRDYLDRHERLSAMQTISLGIQLGEGLEYAHRRGVLHRDLKPSNIMIEPVDGGIGKCKIVDFGLAGFAGGNHTAHRLHHQGLTTGGALIGSVHYMSPEQCQGRQLDSRSDQYSLGCVLYECLQGSPPLQAESVIGLLHLHVNERPPSPKERKGDHLWPAGLDGVIMKTLAKSVQDRYESLMELQADLEKCRVGKGDEIEFVKDAVSNTSAVSGNSWRKRAVIGATAVVILATAVGVITNQRKSEPVFVDSTGRSYPLALHYFPDSVETMSNSDVVRYARAWLGHNLGKKNYSAILQAYHRGFCALTSDKQPASAQLLDWSREACSYFSSHRASILHTMNARELFFQNAVMLYAQSRYEEAEQSANEARYLGGPRPTAREVDDFSCILFATQGKLLEAIARRNEELNYLAPIEAAEVLPNLISILPALVTSEQFNKLPETNRQQVIRETLRQIQQTEFALSDRSLSELLVLLPVSDKETTALLHKELSRQTQLRKRSTAACLSTYATLIDRQAESTYFDKVAYKSLRESILSCTKVPANVDESHRVVLSAARACDRLGRQDEAIELLELWTRLSGMSPLLRAHGGIYLAQLLHKKGKSNAVRDCLQDCMQSLDHLPNHLAATALLLKMQVADQLEGDEQDRYIASIASSLPAELRTQDLHLVDELILMPTFNLRHEPVYRRLIKLLEALPDTDSQATALMIRWRMVERAFTFKDIDAIEQTLPLLEQKGLQLQDKLNSAYKANLFVSLAKGSLTLGLPQKAATYAKRVRELIPQVTDALQLEATAYGDLGQPANARACVQKLLHRPNNQASFFRMSPQYVASRLDLFDGRMQECEQQLEQYRRLTKQSRLLTEAELCHSLISLQIALGRKAPPGQATPVKLLYDTIWGRSQEFMAYYIVNTGLYYACIGDVPAANVCADMVEKWLSSAEPSLRFRSAIELADLYLWLGKRDKAREYEQYAHNCMPSQEYKPFMQLRSQCLFSGDSVATTHVRSFDELYVHKPPLPNSTLLLYAHNLLQSGQTEGAQNLLSLVRKSPCRFEQPVTDELIARHISANR